MTFEVQQNRWDQLVRRVSGSIGPYSRVAETLAELFPTLDVENLPPELLFLSGVKLGWGGTAKTGDPLKNAGIQLFNPADSQNLVVIDQVQIHDTAAQRILIGINSVTLPTDTGLAFLRDSRTGNTIETVAQLRTSGDIVGTINMSIEYDPLAETFILAPPNSLCVLAPGSGLLVAETLLSATNLNVSFFWHERVALESELNF